MKAALALLAAAAPLSPTQNAPPALQAMIASPAYQAYIGRLFGTLPPDMFRRCDTLVSKGSRVLVSPPVVFDGNGHPIAGGWKQSFPVSGCGNDTTINFFFAAQADGKIVTVLGVPGDSRADPLLQKDAVGYAMLAARAKSPSCAASQVIDTADDGPLPQPSGKPRPGREAWHETWTLAACGSRLKVGMRFVPDATGTQITAEPARPAA